MSQPEIKPYMKTKAIVETNSEAIIKAIENDGWANEYMERIEGRETFVCHFSKKADLTLELFKFFVKKELTYSQALEALAKCKSDFINHRFTSSDQGDLLKVAVNIGTFF